MGGVGKGGNQDRKHTGRGYPSQQTFAEETGEGKPRITWVTLSL